MPRDSRAEFIIDTKQLISAYIKNIALLPGLDAVHGELAPLVSELEDLGILQDAQTAAVQQTTKDIDDRMSRAKLLVTRMRNGVKLHLGTRTEKVIEFGIRPFRKRKPEPKPVEKKPVETKEPSAATTATKEAAIETTTPTT